MLYINCLLNRSTGSNFFYTTSFSNNVYFSIKNLSCICSEKQIGPSPFSLFSFDKFTYNHINFDISTKSITCKKLDQFVNFTTGVSFFYVKSLLLQNFQGGLNTILFRSKYNGIDNEHSFENVSILNSSFGAFYNFDKGYNLTLKNISIVNSTIMNPAILLSLSTEHVIKFDNIKIENNTLNGFIKCVAIGNRKNIINIQHFVAKMNTVTGPIIYGYSANIDISDYTSSDNLCTQGTTSDISVSNGETTIRNSFFSQLRKHISYGYINAAYFQIITVIDSTFVNSMGIASSCINTAESCKLLISNTKFINSLKGNAAVSSYFDDYISISNCIFENTTKYALRISMMKGGDLIIADTVFKNFLTSAIYLEDVPSAYIKGCSFSFSTSQGTSAYISGTSYNLIGRGIQARITNLVVENSIFTNTASDENGGAILAEVAYLAGKSLSTVSIKNCQFINSSGIIGGAVYIQAETKEQQKIFRGNIEDCSFINSSSSTAGGALGYSCDKQVLNCSLSISNSKFINNSVTSLSGGGGAIKYFYDNFTNNNNLFQGNYATFASDFFGIPSGILLKVGNKTWNSQCQSDNTNASQGNNSNSIFSLSAQEFESIKIYIYDDNGLLVQQNGLSKATISYNSSTDLHITPISIFEASGIIDFAGMIVNGSYGSISNVTVSVSINEGYYVPSVTMNFSVFIPACVMGEQTTSDRKCIKCPKSKYLYDPGPTCWDCPKNLNCYGGSTVTTTAGYWRFKNTTNFVVSCPNKGSCLAGNENNSLGICDLERGFTGIACSQCLPNYLKATNQCMVCPNSDYTNFFFLILIGFGILAMNIYFILSKIPKENTSRDTKKLFEKHDSQHAIFIKILINHILLVTIIAQFNITWPKNISNVFGVFSQSSAPSQAIYSVECFSRSLALDQDLFYIKLIAAAAFPLVYSLVIFIVWKLIHIFYPSIYETDRIIISIVVISMQFHTGLSQTGFLGMSYMRIDHEELRVVSDLRISAYDRKYLLLGLPFSLFTVLVWGFGLLAFIFFVLFKNRLMIIKGDKATISKYSFLISGYKNQSYFWDLLIQARKFSLALLSSFLVDLSPSFQISFAILLLFVYLYLLLHASPYNDTNLNKIEGISCVVCLVQFIIVRVLFYLDSFY